jgi:DNA-binding transcriptional ArsR family regulator
MAHGDHGNIERLFDDAGYARAAADAMQALSAPSRLRILARLHAGPATVGELAVAVGMEGSAVSHQLRLLRHPGLVVGPRGGRRMVYAISTEPTTGS